MNGYLFIGLLVGAVCVIIHLLLSAAAKKPPALGDAIELLLAAVGASGGVKICGYVISGQISMAFKQSNIAISDEDIIYFAVGGFALIWLSFDVIARKLWMTYQTKHDLAADVDRKLIAKSEINVPSPK